MSKTILTGITKMIKKKIVAFTTEISEVGEEGDEYQDGGMTLINRGVKQMRRQRPQQDFKNNERNDDRCYYCGKPGHFKQNCPEQRRRNNRRNEDPKNLGA